jgi:hypothetical protein
MRSSERPDVAAANESCIAISSAGTGRVNRSFALNASGILSGPAAGPWRVSSKGDRLDPNVLPVPAGE